MTARDIKILHIDSNHPIMLQQLTDLGFTNELDFTSSKEEVEQKIQNYQGIIIRSRFKIAKQLLDKVIKLEFIARVGAGLEFIDCYSTPLASILWECYFLFLITSIRRTGK